MTHFEFGSGPVGVFTVTSTEFESIIFG